MAREYGRLEAKVFVDKSEDENHCRCEYSVMNERCKRSGTISSAVHSGGPWYCLPHYRLVVCGISAERAAKEIVAGPMPDWREDFLQHAVCELRGVRNPMMVIADKLATGVGTGKDKAWFLQVSRDMVRGIGRLENHEV